jgi:putative inorganic carbon (hco3(-)) transporter
VILSVISRYELPKVLILSIYFILISVLIYTEKFEFAAILPFLLIIAYITIRSYDKIFYLIVLLTPLSVNLGYFIPNLPIEISLLTEPLLLLLLVILTVEFLRKHCLDFTILRHRISIAIFLYLIWILISSFASVMPLVSLKFFLSKLWLIIPVFAIGISLFQNWKSIGNFINLHLVGVVIVVIYSTLQIIFVYSLSKSTIHFAVQPFYNDHTAYGAILALIFPPTVGLFLISKNRLQKILYLTACFLLLAGVIISYSRASWLGLLIVAGILVLIRLRIKFKYILAFLLLVITIIFTFWFQLIDRLEKNNQDSSANFAHHITSISNISTDASNVERLNRWHCAIEMFKQKPVFGWGPGTYQFQYAPFQLERMKTIISTDFGDIGNAHSEYLGPLAEQGLPGMLLFIFLTVTILYTGFNIYNKSQISEIKILSLAISLGFVTYFFHGLLNNFLDTDKLAVPFFGFAAILVSLDLFHKKTN